MCDRANSTYGCELVDERDSIIADLEEEIEVLEESLKTINDLQSEIEMKDQQIIMLESEIEHLVMKYKPTIKDVLTPGDIYEGN